MIKKEENPNGIEGGIDMKKKTAWFRVKNVPDGLKWLLGGTISVCLLSYVGTKCYANVKGVQLQGLPKSGGYTSPQLPKSGHLNPRLPR